jgi:SEC-C motif-containing protein
MSRLPSIATLLLILVCMSALITPVASFAAAKKGGGGKKRVASSANKGFGAPPPTWEDVARKIKTRVPVDAAEMKCPCESGSIYKECCAPYHAGDKYPESPLKVLRSRYTALAWRDIRYIIDTTHPTCGDWREDKIGWVKDLNKGGMFDNHDFVGLEPGPEELVGDTEGFITFTVKLRGHEGSEFEGQERVIREKSQFLKGDDGRWTYATGEVAVQL